MYRKRVVQDRHGEARKIDTLSLTSASDESVLRHAIIDYRKNGVATKRESILLLLLLLQFTITTITTITK